MSCALPSVMSNDPNKEEDHKHTRRKNQPRRRRPCVGGAPDFALQTAVKHLPTPPPTLCRWSAGFCTTNSGQTPPNAAADLVSVERRILHYKQRSNTSQ